MRKKQQTFSLSRRLYQSFVTHLLCHCLFLVPFAYTQQSLASEAEKSQVVDQQAAEMEAKRLENLAHEQTAQEKGGLHSRCDGKENDTLSNYFAHQQYMQAYLDQGIDNMITQRNLASNLKNNLNAAEGAQQEADPVITKEYQELTRKADAAKDRRDTARAAYRAARARCPDYNDRNRERYCTPETIAQIRSAHATYRQADREYKRLRSQANDKKSEADATVKNVMTKQQNQIASDAISGCSGSGATKTCQLTGSLFEKDQELTRLANENVEQAKALAKMKSDALFDLELQKQYNGDYRLFESALKVEADSNLNLDEFDQMSINDPRKTSRIAMTISNIKILAFSSAAVKNLKCTQHPKSEADSKAYHLFRAASATYLMAQVNDTGLYSDASSCKAEEAYTSDEKNEQIKTIERAANLSQEQLQNICLSINPTPPVGEYDWRHYGATEEEAVQAVEELAKLKVECDKYLTELRGPEYAGKPRTREAALEMMQTALSMAIEELAAKREKLAIAHANIQKAKAWIKRVQTYIMILLAIAAALMLAAQFLFALPFGVGVPPGTALMQKAILIIAIIVGIFLMSELARAKAFLKEWQRKLELAKYFTHLECNFDQAKAEENALLSMAEQAKKEMEEEMRRRENSIIEQMNRIVNEPPSSTQTQPEASSETNTSFHHPGDPLEFIMSFIPPAHAEENEGPQIRDPKRLARSLGVAYGSESFRYFLSQKVTHWQGQSHDITTSDNLSGKVLRTVDQLAAPFIGGDGSDPLEGLQDFEKQGFPTPETRIVTIQNAINLMTENIARLNGSIVTAAYQRDQYLTLLNEARRRMNIKEEGLSNNDRLSQATVGEACLGASGEFDQTCSCRANKSCSQYLYRGPARYIPPALASDADTALDYGNSVVSGNLEAANITAGSLQVRRKAIRDRLVLQQQQLNETRRQAGLAPRNLASEARNVGRSQDRQAHQLTNRSGINSQATGTSPFARARARLIASDDGTKKATNSNSVAKAPEEASSATGQVKAGGMGANKKPSVLNEKYSLSGLEQGLANHPDDQLALDGANQLALNDDHSSATEDQESDYRYSHQRRHYGNQHHGKSSIHGRHSNLFHIISKRYEETAFPLLLTP